MLSNEEVKQVDKLIIALKDLTNKKNLPKKELHILQEIAKEPFDHALLLKYRGPLENMARRLNSLGETEIYQIVDELGRLVYKKLWNSSVQDRSSYTQVCGISIFNDDLNQSSLTNNNSSLFSQNKHKTSTTAHLLKQAINNFSSDDNNNDYLTEVKLQSDRMVLTFKNDKSSQDFYDKYLKDFTKVTVSKKQIIFTDSEEINLFQREIAQLESKTNQNLVKNEKKSCGIM